MPPIAALIAPVINWTLGFSALLGTFVAVQTQYGLVPHAPLNIEHPWYGLMHSPLRQPPAPVQAVFKMPKAQLKASSPHVIFEWMPDLNTASALSESLNTPVNSLGLPVAESLNEANLTVQAYVTDSWPLIHQGNESGSWYEGCIPDFQHSPFHTPTAFDTVEFILRIVAALFLCNNHVISTAHMIDAGVSITAVGIVAAFLFPEKRDAILSRLCSAYIFMKGIRMTTNNTRCSSLYAQEVEAHAETQRLLDQAREAIDEYDAVDVDFKSRSAELSQKIADIVASLNELLPIITSVKKLKTLHPLIRQLTEVNQALDAANGARNQDSTQADRLTADIQDLGKDLNLAQVQLEYSSAEVTRLTSELRDAQEAYKVAEVEHSQYAEAMENDLTEARSARDAAESRNLENTSRLQEEINALHDAHKDSTTAQEDSRQAVQEQLDEIAKLREENEALRDARKNLETAREDDRRAIEAKYHDDIVKLKKEKEDFRGLCKTSEELLATAHSERVEWGKKNVEQRNAIAALKEQKGTDDTEIKRLGSEMRMMQNEMMSKERARAATARVNQKNKMTTASSSSTPRSLGGATSTSGPDPAEDSQESQDNSSTAASSPHAPSTRAPNTPTASTVSINSTEENLSMPRPAATPKAVPEPDSKPIVRLPGSPIASSEKKPEVRPTSNAIIATPIPTATQPNVVFPGPPAGAPTGPRLTNRGPGWHAWTPSTPESSKSATNNQSGPSPLPRGII